MILAVAVLTMTAGCGGVLDGGATGAGADGAVGGGPTDDEANGTVDYPAGTSEDGLDAAELESRMTTILEDGSYTVETNETLEFETGTYEESIALTVDGERTIEKTTLAYEPATNESMFESSTKETWLYTASANETLVRRAVDSAERYRVERGPSMPTTAERSLRDELAAVLRVSGYEPTDVETAGGSTVVTYEGTGLSDELEELYPLVDEYDEFTATVTVSDDGVERYAYGFEGTTTDGVTETITVDTTFSSLGETTLERPAWVDEGFERAPEASISTHDGEIVALTLESGEPIPENASVSIGTDYYGANLDEALEPGETLYLTARDDRLRASVDVEPDAGDAIDTEWFTVSVRTESGLLAYEGVYER